jgi:hypothetical protein
VQSYSISLKRNFQLPFPTIIPIPLVNCTDYRNRGKLWQNWIGLRSVTRGCLRESSLTSCGLLAIKKLGPTFTSGLYEELERCRAEIIAN